MRGFSAVIRQSPSDAAFVSVAILLLCMGGFFRLYGLDHLPGINGDEAVLQNMLRAGSFFHATSGRVLDPLLATTWGISRLLFNPSFFELRFSSVLASFLAIAGSFFLLKKEIGWRAALLTALLLSSLPISIAYARLTQEPSQSPLYLLLCTWCALRKRPIPLFLIASVAIAVYPTNVFALPFLLAILAERYLNGAHAMMHKRSFAWKLLLLIAAFAIALTFLYVGFFRSWFSVPVLLEDGLSRASSLEQLLSFLELLMHFTNGVTVYTYIVGDVADGIRTLFLTLTYVLLGSVFIASLGWVAERPRHLSSFVTIGLIVSVLIFFFIAGPTQLGPHLERRGSWLIFPICLWIAMVVDRFSGRAGRLCQWSTVVACLLLLVSFHSQYLSRLQESNSSSHITFLTGAVEPKQAALEIIARNHDPHAPAMVLTEDWWIFWPLKYLAGKDYAVRAIDGAGWPCDCFPNEQFPSEHMVPRERFYVVWKDGNADKTLQFNASLLGTVSGYQGIPLLSVYRAY